MRNNKTAKRDIRSPIEKKHENRMLHDVLKAHKMLYFTQGIYSQLDNPHWRYLRLTVVKIK